MCQQWLSVAGLTLDIIGFALICFEWWGIYLRDYQRRLGELGEDAARFEAELKGKKYRAANDLDHTMWRPFQKMFLREHRFRGKLFIGGAFLVLLGFFGQLFGSWPGGLAILALKNC